MKTILKSIVLSALLALSTVASALELLAGWNLVANNANSAISASSYFSDQTKITSVWRWNKTTGKWAFYSPSLTASELSAFAASKNYEVLTSIPTKEGYWVSAKAAVNIPTPDDWAYVKGADLQNGWNLVSGSYLNTPIQIIQNVNWKLTPANKQVSTMWVWNSTTNKWKFYSPALAAQGGTVLADYAASRGYEVLRYVVALEGVWINVTAGAQAAPATPASPKDVVMECNPIDNNIYTFVNQSVNPMFATGNYIWGTKNMDPSKWSQCVGAAVKSEHSAMGRFTWDFKNYGINQPGIAWSKAGGQIIYGHNGWDWDWEASAKPAWDKIFPKQFSATKSITASFDVEITHSPASVAGTVSSRGEVDPGDGGSLTFDLWISPMANPSPGQMKMELMITPDSWGSMRLGANDPCGCKPAGPLEALPIVTIGGKQYYYKESPGPVGQPVIHTYISVTPTYKGSLDIMDFIKDQIARGKLASTDWIHNINLGMELAEGKGETIVNDYTVNVE